MTYTQTYNELQRAALLLDDIKPCKLHGCEFCLALNSVLNHPRLEAYIQSPAFQNDMLPVDTAQCNNIFGLGNFTREVFDMDPNMCKCHLLGEQLHFFLIYLFPMMYPLFRGLQALLRRTIHTSTTFRTVKHLLGVPTFKDYAVKSLLSYLREHINDKAADGTRSTGPAPAASTVFVMRDMPGQTTTWALRSTGAISRNKFRPPPVSALS